MNNSVFWKTMENVRKYRDIKLARTGKRRIKLVSEPNYHTTKQFSENLMTMEMKKSRVKWISHYTVSIRYKQNVNVWILAWLC